MAAATSVPSPGAAKFGDLYDAIQGLKDSATELFSQYENDDPVSTLAASVMSLRQDAQKVETVLDNIVVALQDL